MVSYSGLTREINGTKRRLIQKAKKKGIYENFGQTEIRKLRDKYQYTILIYGSEKERAYAAQIDALEDWVMNYTG